MECKAKITPETTEVLFACRNLLPAESRYRSLKVSRMGKGCLYTRKGGESCWIDEPTIVDSPAAYRWKHHKTPQCLNCFETLKSLRRERNRIVGIYFILFHFTTLDIISQLFMPCHKEHPLRIALPNQDANLIRIPHTAFVFLLALKIPE